MGNAKCDSMLMSFDDIDDVRAIDRSKGDEGWRERERESDMENEMDGKWFSKLERMRCSLKEGHHLKWCRRQTDTHKRRHTHSPAAINIRFVWSTQMAINHA